MNLTTFFRWLLASSILLALIGVIAEFATAPLLPEILQDYLNQDMESEITSGDLMLLALAIPSLALLVAGYIGLFKLKAWGRNCFIFSSIILYLMTPLMGPFVLTSVSYIFYDLASVCMGAIVAMIYLSPIRDLIESKQNS